jgi:hypothetical protein
MAALTFDRHAHMTRRRGKLELLRILGWALIVVLGGLLLSPAVAYFDLEPLPGDFHLTVGDMHLYIPLVTSMIPSGALTLLFLIMRR